jgi:hypothetical protein
MSYDTTEGRWIEEDPAHYIDGVNLYQLEGGSPIKFLDPTGTVRKKIVIEMEPDPTWTDDLAQWLNSDERITPKSLKDATKALLNNSDGTPRNHNDDAWDTRCDKKECFSEIVITGHNSGGIMMLANYVNLSAANLEAIGRGTSKTGGPLTQDQKDLADFLKAIKDSLCRGGRVVLAGCNTALTAQALANSGLLGKPNGAGGIDDPVIIGTKTKIKWNPWIPGGFW